MSRGATANIELRQAQSPEDWLAARRLVEEYAATLDVDLAFQNFAHEKEHLASEYSPPDGAFLIATERDATLGCAALRRFAGEDGEIKRLYVVPAARGRGLGALLARQIVAQAKQLGYARVLLDTLPAMREARALYQSLGFKPTSAYRFNPVPGAAYFELTLR